MDDNDGACVCGCGVCDVELNGDGVTCWCDTWEQIVSRGFSHANFTGRVLKGMAISMELLLYSNYHSAATQKLW